MEGECNGGFHGLSPGSGSAAQADTPAILTIHRTSPFIALDHSPHWHYRLVNLVKGSIVTDFVNLYEAKTQLSALVDRAAAGEEIVIAKNGVPRARLMPVERSGERRKPANAMRIEYVAADFDASDPHIEQMFGGDTK
ncbi:MAG: type toxin-antitoxin system prevent-host-death family antitoxin [Rhodopila sp.]|jgi:prevent-host-death family protein|nr:type toxin-antitoxin system prevent-host-death family antitoxin [Rhodopila sp.]